MKKTSALAMAASVFLALGLAAEAASAEERLYSNNFARNYRGDQVVDLERELYLSGLRGTLNAVIVIASSDRARGMLELVIDGYTVDRRQLGRNLESIQFFVGRDLRRIRDLRLYLRGDVDLAFIGVTVDDGRDRPVPGPNPGPRPGPNPGPNPPAPVPHPVPGPTQPQIVSDVEFNGFIRELQTKSFDSDREYVVRQYSSYWSRRLITMHQLSATLGQFRFDDGRLGALRILRPIVIVDQALMNVVLSKFDFDSNREQARRILLVR